MSPAEYIGIFDSGVGGLTVAREINRLLPGEKLLYFGDSIHLPYGNKSSRSVMEYTFSSIDMLVRKGSKLIVIACNTATAVALPRIRRSYKIPVIGVIQPGVKAALRKSDNKRIGIIGTYRTINSKAYSKAIKKKTAGCIIYEKACPLLVPVIEEGFKNRDIIDAIIREYLDKLIPRIDTLVLGCTHYPLIKHRLKKIYPGINIVDSARETAKATRQALQKNSLLSRKAAPKKQILIQTNDLNEIFDKIACKIFKKKDISLKEVK